MKTCVCVQVYKCLCTYLHAALFKLFVLSFVLLVWPSGSCCNQRRLTRKPAEWLQPPFNTLAMQNLYRVLASSRSTSLWYSQLPELFKKSPLLITSSQHPQTTDAQTICIYHYFWADKAYACNFRHTVSLGTCQPISSNWNEAAMEPEAAIFYFA